MSRLVALIDAYRDAHGQPSEASIARAIGVAPQTINSWRKRGIKEPPSRDALVALAGLLRVDQRVVGEAVAVDIGLLPPPEAEGPSASDVG